MKERGRGLVLNIFIASDITKFKGIIKSRFNLSLYSVRKIFFVILFLFRLLQPFTSLSILFFILHGILLNKDLTE